MTAPSVSATTAPADRRAGAVLLVAIFVAAICGLVYELIAGTLSSYLLGDSVTQFSIVIGLFLTAMGGGSFLSKYITHELLARLIAIEMIVGLVGGFTALIGFAAFSFTEAYLPIFLTLVGAVGVLIGLEVPLLVRILRDLHALPVSLAHVLSADYLGALAASVLFPFLLLPHLGLIRAGLVMGLVNVLIAGVVLWRLRDRIGPRFAGLRRGCVVCTVLLVVAIGASEPLTGFMENALYQDDIILACDSPHQRIVVTRWRDDVRLYLNGHLQFSSVDEHRYHEALVHPAMAAAARRARVLILGGGDGLAAREVARYAAVEHIDLVDLDATVTNLFATRPLFRALNGNVYDDARVRVHNIDAMRFLEQTPALYDVVLMDLPDPSSPAVAKLYSRAFFNLVGRHLGPGAILATQGTSPFRAREAYWCIVHTIAQARCGGPAGGRFRVRPYHTVVPTFGTWGFVLAGADVPEPTALRMRVATRYLTDALLPGLFEFPLDMAEVTTPISRLDNPVVCHLYHYGYHKYLD